MLSMGMLNKDAVEGGFCGEKLGIECAGVVTKIGAKTANLAIGDRVVAVAKNSYSTYLYINCCLIVIVIE
jgi:NADPH:quinone reductase-like Zn-dependent oxidoreductase